MTKMMWWNLQRMSIRIRHGCIVSGRARADLNEQMFLVNRALTQLKIGNTMEMHYKRFVTEMNR